MRTQGALLRRQTPVSGGPIYVWAWSWWHRHNRRVRVSRAAAAATAVPLPIRAGPDELTRPSQHRRIERQRRALLRLLVLGLLLVLVTGLGWWAYHWLLGNHHFAVQTIRVVGARHLNADVLRQRAGIELGESVFTVDLAQVERNLQTDPWIKRVRVRRELPGSIAIDVQERQAACLVALGPLYLAEADGEVYKRATAMETEGLVVVTGIPRDGYVDDRDASRALIREGLQAMSLWRERVSGASERPALGEVHVDAALGAMLYLADQAVGVRLGTGDTTTLRERLQRFDAAWRALQESGEQAVARLILLDQRAHPERVTVKLAGR